MNLFEIIKSESATTIEIITEYKTQLCEIHD